MAFDCAISRPGAPGVLCWYLGASAPRVLDILEAKMLRGDIFSPEWTSGGPALAPPFGQNLVPHLLRALG